MMTDPLDIYQMRVESARMLGEMPEYVRDVQALLNALRYSTQRIEYHEKQVDRARRELATLRQQASMKDTIETKASDYQLMVVGAERIAKAFDGEE